MSHKLSLIHRAVKKTFSVRKVCLQLLKVSKSSNLLKHPTLSPKELWTESLESLFSSKRLADLIRLSSSDWLGSAAVVLFRDFPGDSDEIRNLWQDVEIGGFHSLPIIYYRPSLTGL